MTERSEAPLSRMFRVGKQDPTVVNTVRAISYQMEVPILPVSYYHLPPFMSSSPPRHPPLSDFTPTFSTHIPRSRDVDQGVSQCSVNQDDLFLQPSQWPEGQYSQ
ncbi:hypothetical protein BaRGS_00001537 [Batillaria attramentaria]|uniref:Uncharacterized protein n=1 Tax=Batillaria attramentaria TaxID=370345 RepID=A0ABD0M7E6_9CAEN